MNQDPLYPILEQLFQLSRLKTAEELNANPDELAKHRYINNVKEFVALVPQELQVELSTEVLLSILIEILRAIQEALPHESQGTFGKTLGIRLYNALNRLDTSTPIPEFLFDQDRKPQP